MPEYQKFRKASALFIPPWWDCGELQNFPVQHEKFQVSLSSWCRFTLNQRKAGMHGWALTKGILNIYSHRPTIIKNALERGMEIAV
jgi:hypothetical protein